MIMGTRNGSAVAHQVLSDIISEIVLDDLDAKIVVYVDDIFCTSSSLETLECAVRRLLTVLNKYMIKLSPLKTAFGGEIADFLSFTWIPGHIKPGRKYSKILNSLVSMKHAETAIYSMNYYVRSVVGLQRALSA